MFLCCATLLFGSTITGLLQKSLATAPHDGVDCMKIMLKTLPHGRQCLCGQDTSRRYFYTTLYERIEARYDQIVPGEEALVLAILMDMALTGRLVWHGADPEERV
jgi:hypothetical protein